MTTMKIDKFFWMRFRLSVSFARIKVIMEEKDEGYVSE